MKALHLSKGIFTTGSPLFHWINTWIPLIVCGLMLIGFLLWHITPYIAIGAFTLLFVVYLMALLERLGRRATKQIGNTTDVLLGHIDISSNRLVVGDATFPVAGISIVGIPNDRAEIRGTASAAGRQLTLLRLRVDLRDPEGEVINEIRPFVVETAMVCIADPRGWENVPTGGIDDAAKAFTSMVIHAGNALSQGDQCSHVINDERRTPWAVVCPAGLGDGEYDLVISRDRLGVCRIACDFV